MPKGIILAGGSGTRLYPMTSVINKHLLPVFDKPMVYYPLTTLMLGGVDDILLITAPEHQESFQRLFDDGSKWGLNISYACQARPEGIAQAFLIGARFIGDDSVTLILGDNIFYGHGLPDLLRQSTQNNSGATIFVHYVRDPERYGVIEFSEEGKVLGMEEKPARPRSNFAVTGLYCYDASVVNVAKDIAPSKRGELEITDINLAYLRNQALTAEILGRGMTWFDVGTPEALASAGQFIGMVENSQNTRVACPEEAAYRMGYIDAEQLERLAAEIGHAPYGKYLRSLIDEPHPRVRLQ